MFFSRYYEVVVMKVNKTSLVRKPAHLFENLTTYEGASYNQPYVTGVLERDYFDTYEVRDFSLGMNISLILSSDIRASVELEVLKYKRAMTNSKIHISIKHIKQNSFKLTICFPGFTPALTLRMIPLDY